MDSIIGRTEIMNCGEKCTIIEYINNYTVKVKFELTDEIVKTSFSNFKNKCIKSHFSPTVLGIGIVGLEKTRDKNKNKINSYNHWREMLKRCYDENYKNKYTTYKYCTVCETWRYYKNFKEWYNENYYKINNEVMCLDKDVVNKNSKIYSPENCVFVPENINLLFTRRNKSRGKYPIGVTFKKNNNKFESKCSYFDYINKKRKTKYLGLYDTSEKAFDSYKIYKENYIKQIANEYKNKIPLKLYEAMYRYEVEITD